jgi:hypothetical protein
MTSLELLESLHKDLKTLSFDYNTHVIIQQLIEAYKSKLKEQEK